MVPRGVVERADRQPEVGIKTLHSTIIGAEICLSNHMLMMALRNRYHKSKKQKGIGLLCVLRIDLVMKDNQ